MALDKSRTVPAYVCGRLFAVLEDIQLQSANYNLNTTIRDRYLTAASSYPATTFATLLNLSQHHMGKLKSTKCANEAIQEIVALLDGSFPKRLVPVERAEFMVGYYHQKADIAARKDAAIKEKQKNNQNNTNTSTVKEDDEA